MLSVRARPHVCSAEDQKIVGIADKAVAAAFQLLVTFIQHHIPQ